MKRLICALLLLLMHEQATMKADDINNNGISFEEVETLFPLLEKVLKLHTVEEIVQYINQYNQRIREALESKAYTAIPVSPFHALLLFSNPGEVQFLDADDKLWACYNDKDFRSQLITIMKPDIQEDIDQTIMNFLCVYIPGIIFNPPFLLGDSHQARIKRIELLNRYEKYGNGVRVCPDLAYGTYTFEKDFGNFVLDNSLDKQKPASMHYAQKDLISDDLVAELLNDAPDRIEIILNRLQLADQIDDYQAQQALLTDKILLIGPPGVGKSVLAKAIAQKIDRPFVYLHSSLIANEYQNSGSQNLRRIIEDITQNNESCVIIFDEIHCLFDTKKNKNTNDNVSAALWQLLDACSANKNILFIGTSNDLKNMPAPLKSRFNDNFIVEISLPKEQLRERVLNFYLRNHGSAELISSIAYDTDGFSCRELKDMALEMLAHAFEDGAGELSDQDYMYAYHQIRSGTLEKGSWGRNANKFLKKHGQTIGHCLTIGGFLLTYYQFKEQLKLNKDSFLYQVFAGERGHKLAEQQTDMQKESLEHSRLQSWLSLVRFFI